MNAEAQPDANAETEESSSFEVDSPTMRRAVGSAAVGNALEWFDFGVYGYFAVIIGQVFFPTHSKTAALLSSFAVFATAFAARPIGSFVFGPLVDRIGRRSILVVTILMMTGGTAIIGVLPSYATVGIWAPVMLVIFRMVQGFSTGGEYGSAATFICEYASDSRRGFWGSWLEVGTMTGYSVAAVLSLILNGLLSQEAMQAWAWRIPFLCALPIGLVGLYLRTHLEDSPTFNSLKDSGESEKTPMRTTFKYHWRSMLLCVGMVIMLNVGYYVVLKYMPSYLTKQLGMSEFRSLVLSLAILIFIGILIPCFGRLSDTIGRRPMWFIACAGFLLGCLPAFYLMHLGTFATSIGGLAILAIVIAIVGGNVASTLPPIFRTNVRGTGFNISYNVSTSAFGGTAPLIVTAIIAATGNEYTPAFYLMGAAFVTLITTYLIQESANRPLPGSRGMRSTRRNRSRGQAAQHSG